MVSPLSSSRFVAGLVVVLVVGGGAFRFGYSTGKNSVAAAQAEAADAAAERARASAEAAVERNREFQAAEVGARSREVSRRARLEHDIARRPADAGCGLDAAAVQLFNDAVRDANDEPAAPGPVPGAMPTDSSTDGREPERPP